MKQKTIFSILIVIFLFLVLALSLFILFYDIILSIQEKEEREMTMVPIENNETNKLIEIIKYEINNSNISHGNCLDYALYYNQSLRKYTELDIRFPRHFDICNNLTFCDSYHTFLVVGGWGTECILDQRSYACLKLRGEIGN